MSIPLFVPGQRWISNTESELGLGIVLEVAHRRVHLSFPAAAERRTYALDNAPLSRVRYEVGQEISTQDEQCITVSNVIEEHGGLIYQGLSSDGELLSILEIELNCFVQFSKPQERLFAGQIDKNRAFQMRCDTLEHIRRQQQSPVRGLLGARVALLPHQLYIASEIASRHAPRVLLADEVGLGKTIEAGLILHQQLISGRATRAIIVVPDSLLHQWLVEMLRRFNLFFTLLDEDRCEGLEEDSDDYNPFESAQLVLCTLSFLTNNKKRIQQATDSAWDLLIVDEAHHLQWSETQISEQYLCVEALAKRAKGLLLLTATPEQLGIESHFARLRLLDPDRYFDLALYREEEKKHQPVNQLVQALLAETACEDFRQQPQLLIQLESYLGGDRLESLTALIESDEDVNGEDFSLITRSVIRDLLDRHGTGRVLFRNTRSSMSGFPERKLHTYALAAPDLYLASITSAQLPQLLAPESMLGSNWLLEDTRVEWLVAFLKEHRGKKVLLICAKAATALELEDYLSLRQGVQSSVFHEGLSLLERDRAAAYFADPDEGAQLLVCSEIGSEGRNFQFAHHLVLFDLPLNPDLLEQRIGRLDRIGQREIVNIHVPYYTDSAQHKLLRWYHEGFNAFEQTFAAGSVLFEEFCATLLHCLAGGDAAEFEQLLVQTTDKAAHTAMMLQKGRDRLLELNSCDHVRADEIVTDMIEEERRQELSSYMEQVADLFGVEQEYHSAVSVVFRPGDHMVCHSFPGLSEDGMTATYQRDMALSREDMHFLTWEHPMVLGAMDMVLSGEIGNTAFCALTLPPLKPGTLLLEAIFTVQCSAPAHLQLHRYLPLTTIRVVVDSNKTHLTKVLTPDRLNSLAEKIPKHSSQELIRHARTQIIDMITQAEELAQQQKIAIVEQAESMMENVHTEENARLAALALVNPNIRQEELEYWQASKNNLQNYLNVAQLKLDALRVAIVRK